MLEKKARVKKKERKIKRKMVGPAICVWELERVKHIEREAEET